MKQKRIPAVWFYKPELYWRGWRGLIPFYLGGDEYNRHTFVLGWSFTGEMVVVYKRCKQGHCNGWQTPEEIAETERWYEEDQGS